MWWWLSLGCTGHPVPLDRFPAEPRPSGDRPLCAEEPTAPFPDFAPDLDAWADALADSDNRYLGERGWQALEARGETGWTDPTAESLDRILRGWSRLKFGDLSGAITDLERAEALAPQNDDQRGLERARQLLGVAWLRTAETVNCLPSGSGESCIVPFGEHAIHADPTMMTNASAAFGRALAANLDQPVVQWLDNVTYMARGTWPDDVPAAWVLPPEVLEAEAPFPAWSNVAPEIGFDEARISGGAAIEDVDGDGRPDLLVSTMDSRDGMDLWLNEGDGGFCRASDASGVSSIPSLLSFSTADYDNDGDVDVMGPRAGWIGAEGTVRPSLLRNDGEGRFTDVAVAAGLDDPAVNGPTQVAAWGDVDGDGWLDVFVGRESEDAVPRVSSLYRNRGDGTFEDIAETVGLRDPGWVKGAAFFDYDRDGDLDLAVSVFLGPNHLYENRGGTFVDRAAELGMQAPLRSFALAPIDYDQDGWQDLFVAGFAVGPSSGDPLGADYFRSSEGWVRDHLGLPPAPELEAETARMYHNRGDGTFEDLTEQLGLDDVHATMGMSHGDFDADSFPDLLLSTGAPEFDALEPNAAYHNDRGTAFVDVTATMGTGALQKGHAVSFGDLDEDGDQDLLVELGGAFVGDPAPSQVFVNPTNEGPHVHRHTVILRLEGVTVNRDALHARIEVVTPLGALHHVVGEGGSFGNASRQVEVGLGDADTITAIEIAWPGEEAETVTDVPVDHVVWIRQGEGVVDDRPYDPVVIDGSAGSHAH